MANETGFRIELEELINLHNMQSGSDTADCILAEYMLDCLKAFDKAVNKRFEMHSLPAPQEDNTHADEANNKTEVDDMAKKGRRPKEEKKKKEPKEETSSAETQEMTEETPTGEEAD